jgi:type VII secretion effector (TIGR04197 family)
MSEIHSNKMTLEKETQVLKQKTSSLSQTHSIVSTSSFTNVTANKRMKDVFGDSLLLTDQYCGYLAKDIQRIMSIAESFEDQDHAQASAIRDVH